MTAAACSEKYAPAVLRMLMSNVFREASRAFLLTMAFGCGALSAFKLRKRSYLRSTRSRRQLLALVRRLRRSTPHFHQAGLRERIFEGISRCHSVRPFLRVYLVDAATYDRGLDANDGPARISCGCLPDAFNDSSKKDVGYLMLADGPLYSEILFTVMGLNPEFHMAVIRGATCLDDVTPFARGGVDHRKRELFSIRI